MTTNGDGTTPLPVENDRQFTTRAWLILVGWTVGVILIGALMGVLSILL